MSVLSIYDIKYTNFKLLRYNLRYNFNNYFKKHLIWYKISSVTHSITIVIAFSPRDGRLFQEKNCQESRRKSYDKKFKKDHDSLAF